jgi:hypothetical protein
MQSITLPAPWRKPLLIVHVVATVSLIGTTLVLIALGISGLRGADPRSVYPAAYLVEAWLVAPLAILSLSTGLLQAVLTRWGPLQYWWVVIKFTTTLGFTGLVLFVLIPRLAASAEAASAAQTFSAAERLPLALVPSVALTALILNVALAIYKPTWRLRGSTAAEAARLGAQQE